MCGMCYGAISFLSIICKIYVYNAHGPFSYSSIRPHIRANGWDFVNCEWQQPQGLNSLYYHCFNSDVFITVLYSHSFVDLGLFLFFLFRFCWICCWWCWFAFLSFNFCYALSGDLTLCALCSSAVRFACNKMYLYFCFYACVCVLR